MPAQDLLNSMNQFSGNLALQYVTLDQAAALVNRSKKTLERYVADPKRGAPAPDVEGGGGKPHEWLYEMLRPWLEQQFSRKLPERFPASQFQDARADRS